MKINILTPFDKKFKSLLQQISFYIPIKIKILNIYTWQNPPHRKELVNIILWDDWSRYWRNNGYRQTYKEYYNREELQAFFPLRLQ